LTINSANRNRNGIMRRKVDMAILLVIDRRLDFR
jgi:hypothetical protein